MADYDRIRSAIFATIPSAYNKMVMTDMLLARRLDTLEKHYEHYQATGSARTLVRLLRIIDATICNVQDNMHLVTDSENIVNALKEMGWGLVQQMI